MVSQSDGKSKGRKAQMDGSQKKKMQNLRRKNVECCSEGMEKTEYKAADREVVAQNGTHDFQAHIFSKRKMFKLPFIVQQNVNIGKYHNFQHNLI